MKSRVFALLSMHPRTALNNNNDDTYIKTANKINGFTYSQSPSLKFSRSPLGEVHDPNRAGPEQKAFQEVAKLTEIRRGRRLSSKTSLIELHVLYLAPFSAFAFGVFHGKALINIPNEETSLATEINVD